MTLQEENERLREVLRCIADLPMDRCSTENDYRLSAAKAIALDALSQQAESECGCCGQTGECDPDCDTRLVQPAPAQDEREMGELRVSLNSGRRQFEFEEYDAAYQLPAGTHYLYTRPAQTEQSGLVAALEYYANGGHLLLADPDAWDTCSGEPMNFLHDEAGTASIEDGSIARVALETYRAALSAQGESHEQGID